MTDALTVFYDGGCPVCTREIDFYRRRSGAERIGWVNIDPIDEPEVSPGLSKADAMARFHVRTRDGRLLSGARAFAALWTELTVFRPFGRIMAAPGFVQLFEVLYRVFLRVRTLWRPKRCEAGVCDLPQR